MKYLLNDERLNFIFKSLYVTCHNYDTGYYQTNGILSFAIMDLAFKIIKQQRRKSIVLKKRKPIIHLLNYVDILNFNSKKFDIDLFLKNEYKSQLIYNLYLYRNLYRREYYKDFYKDSLRVIERENSCIIRLEYDYASRIQPKNSNLVAVLMHILEKKELDVIDVNGIIFYCVFLM